ncbi:MAG TPA: hypothetical protein VMJ64_12900 [Anaerolineales bacterium]|nr:hypothetical protein [Anaerolineales bacterium]
MFLQEILEVIIGLVFIWLLLSTATMQVVEWIANALKWRAVDLHKNIRRMLNDDDLTTRFYDHPLIRTLAEQKRDQDTLPSYIPANKFSTVLLNVIENAETEGSLLLHELYSLVPLTQSIKPAARRQQARTDLERLIELARLSMSAEGGEAMGNLMLTTVQKEIADLSARYPELHADPQAALERVAADKARIDALVGGASPASSAGDFNKVLQGMLALGVTNPGLRLTLSSLFIGIEEASVAGSDCLQLLRNNIETWFNDSMDRLSGRYKRKAQWTAFLIGVVIASAANVDTINVANQLWREPILRQAITANAAQIAQPGQTNPPALTDLVNALQDQYLNVSLPIGWTLSKPEVLSGQTCSILARPGSTFGLALSGGCLRPVDTPLNSDGWIWPFSKVMGLLITGLATSQGSAFWFDVLVKIVNVRGAGLKPA